MRVLFLETGYPGGLAPLAARLAEEPGNEVLFASCRQRRDFSLPGVRRVRLKHTPLFGGALPDAPRLWEEAVRRGGCALRTLAALRKAWGAPDILFASLAGGAALFAPQVFPESFFVSYAESGPRGFALLPEAARAAWNLLQGAFFLRGNLCFCFSEGRRRQFPERLWPGIQLVPPCVDTRVFSRAAAEPWAAGESPAAPLLTLDGAGLDGRQLAALLGLGHAVLQALPKCRAVMLTENDRLREALEKAVAAWPAASGRRFSAYASLPFRRYRDLLAASSLVLCPGCGVAVERPLLECMSCETPLMARAGAADFLRPGVNMLALPAGGPELAAHAVIRALASEGEELARVARAARRDARARFSEEVVAPAHLAQVMRAYTAWKRERGLSAAVPDA